jgi:hypothetical protein
VTGFLNASGEARGPAGAYPPFRGPIWQAKPGGGINGLNKTIRRHSPIAAGSPKRTVLFAMLIWFHAPMSSR